jgi:hypothetical protein
MAAELVYPYRQSLGRSIFAMLFFGLPGVFFLHKADANQLGMRLYYFIRLRPSEATIVYYMVAAFLLVLAALMAYSMIVSFNKKMEIALGPVGVRLPVGVTRRETTITYADIKSIHYKKSRTSEFLTIAPNAGKSAVIASMMLPSKEAFAQLRAELSARACSAQQL